MVRIERVSPQNFGQYLEEVGKLRIEIFRDFPYLYEGTLDYELEYLEVYQRSEKAVWVLAWDGAEIVGVSTAIPLVDEDVSFLDAFRANKIDPAEVFYFGESILKEQYRGMGIGHQFFDERERHVRSFNMFKSTAFAAVDRKEDDHRRPSNYRDLKPFWCSRGYVCQPNISIYISWKELDEAEESQKKLTVWMKSLEVENGNSGTI